jgi:hypothetical protein
MIKVGSAREGTTAANRESIVVSLREPLGSEAKLLVGDRVYHRFPSTTGLDSVQIDEVKIAEDACYDGKRVLRTNTELDAAEVALQQHEQGRWRKGHVHQYRSAESEELMLDDGAIGKVIERAAGKKGNEKTKETLKEELETVAANLAGQESPVEIVLARSTPMSWFILRLQVNVCEHGVA